MEKNKLKIGVYCRVSSDSQKENTSLKNQKDNGISFCERMNYDYEIFSETISGGKGFEDREMFNDLSGKLLNKKLDGVWFNYWDRGWRDDGLKYLFIQLVKDSGCKVYVGSEEKDILSDEGSFELGFFSLMSDYERKRIVNRFKSGKVRRLEKGEIFVGVKGIGYERIGKTLRVNESERQLIVDCFEKYLNKSVKSYRDLVNILKRKYGEGLNKKINEKSLSRLLKDEKYKGIAKIHFDGIDYDVEIGRIISDELFERVNNKIEKVKGKNRGYRKKKYVLEGKVICNNCKSNMWIIGGNSYNYFRCSDKINSKRKNWDGRFAEDYKIKCNSLKDNKISLIQLENIVWEILFVVLRNSESVKEEYFKKYKSEEVNKNEFKGKLSYYTKEIEKEENKKFGVLDRLMNGDINKEEKDILIRGLENRIKELKKKFKEVEFEFEKVENSDLVINYLDRFLDDLKLKYNINRVVDKKRFLEKYIEEISVERIGKNENKKEVFNLNIKFNLKDIDIFEEIENEVIDNVGFNEYNISISNQKGMYLKDLIYKDILCLNIGVKVNVSWKYIDYKSVRILNVV